MVGLQARRACGAGGSGDNHSQEATMRRRRPQLSAARARMRRAVPTAALITIALAALAAAANATPVPGTAVWGNNTSTIESAGVIYPVQVAQGLRSYEVLTAEGNLEGTFKPVLHGASAVAEGGEAALAIVGGAVMQVGQQPSPSTERKLVNYSTWTALEGLESGVTAVAQGGQDPYVSAKNEDLGIHDLALKEGQVYAWGDNEHGQIGDGTEAYASRPVPVSLPEEAVAVAAGDGWSLALLKSGTVYAWGEDENGELGIGKAGKKYDSPTPVKVNRLSGVTAIAAGGDDSIALLSGGTVWAWGRNSAHELGSAIEVNQSSEPIEVAGLSGVTSIAAGGIGAGGDKDHNYAFIGGSDKVLAWGRGKDGEFGNGANEDSGTPVEVPLAHVTTIGAGAEGGIAGGPRFPIIEAVSPLKGPAKGGQEVTIRGKNLLEASSVTFGGNPAKVLLDEEELIDVEAPAGTPKKVRVAVSTPVGTATTASIYLYEPSGVLEFGRCLTVGKGLGSYGSSRCTEPEAGGKFEWTTTIEKNGFSLGQKEKVAIETAAGAVVTCRGGGGGGGEYTGTKTVGAVVIALTECTEGSSALKSTPKCTSPGAAEGEIRTSALEGELGYENLELNNVALDLAPIEEGLFAKFTCAGTTGTVEVRGIVFGSISPPNNTTTSMKLNYTGSKGKQKILGFEHETTGSLEVSVGGTWFVKANLNGPLTITNQEGIEINTVV